MAIMPFQNQTNPLVKPMPTQAQGSAWGRMQPWKKPIQAMPMQPKPMPQPMPIQRPVDQPITMQPQPMYPKPIEMQPRPVQQPIPENTIGLPVTPGVKSGGTISIDRNNPGGFSINPVTDMDRRPLEQLQRPPGLGYLPEDNVSQLQQQWNARRAGMGRPILGNDAYQKKVMNWKTNGMPAWAQNTAMTPNTTFEDKGFKWGDGTPAMVGRTNQINTF